MRIKSAGAYLTWMGWSGIDIFYELKNAHQQQNNTLNHFDQVIIEVIGDSKKRRLTVSPSSALTQNLDTIRNTDKNDFDRTITDQLDSSEQLSKIKELVDRRMFSEDIETSSMLDILPICDSYVSLLCDWMNISSSRILYWENRLHEQLCRLELKIKQLPTGISQDSPQKETIKNVLAANIRNLFSGSAKAIRYSDAFVRREFEKLQILENSKTFSEGIVPNLRVMRRNFNYFDARRVQQIELFKRIFERLNNLRIGI